MPASPFHMNCNNVLVLIIAATSFKSLGPKVAGPHESVGIRADARWNVPEPELALIPNSRSPPGHLRPPTRRPHPNHHLRHRHPRKHRPNRLTPFESARAAALTRLCPIVSPPLSVNEKPALPQSAGRLVTSQYSVLRTPYSTFHLLFRQLLERHEPVIHRRIRRRLLHPLLCHPARTRRRHNHIVPRLPVRRRGAPLRV
jgi:hypothetical protein